MTYSEPMGEDKLLDLIHKHTPIIYEEDEIELARALVGKVPKSGQCSCCPYIKVVNFNPNLELAMKVVDEQRQEIEKLKTTPELSREDLKSIIRCVDFSPFERGETSKGKLCEVIADALISKTTLSNSTRHKKALEDIVKHMNWSAGSNVHLSAIYRIATKALMEKDGDDK